MTVPLSALLLVIAASLGWAGFDLLRKLLVREVPPVALVLLLTLGSAPLFAVWLVVAGAGVRMPPAAYWLPALGSVALNVAANLLFLQGMRIAPISVTVPLLSLTPVFATLMAVPLLGERPTPAGGIGILLVIAGALWLNAPRRRDGGEPAPPGERRRALGGAAMVAATALFWSLTIPLDKLAVERGGAPFHATVVTGGVAVAVFVLLAARGGLGDLARARRVPGLLALALVVSTVALGLQFLALPRMLVSTVETLKRGIGNAMALVSGRLVLGEPVTVPKVLAVLLMAVGVGLILGW